MAKQDINRWEIPPEWVYDDEELLYEGGGRDVHRSPGASGGISQGSRPRLENNFIGDPYEGDVVVARSDPDAGTPENVDFGINLGWNGGAYSLGTLPEGWVGLVSFDVPDVQGARPGGVAVGFSPVAEVPAGGRNGYGHLHHGLVFTAQKVRVIFAGVLAREIPYADLRAAREVDAGTDQVYALMYGDAIKWVVNGVALFAGEFAIVGDAVLDATMYLAYDMVDNPRFIPGEWGDDFPELEDGSLNGSLPRLGMVCDATMQPELVAVLPGLRMRMSETDYSDMTVSLPGLGMTSFYTDGMVVLRTDGSGEQDSGEAWVVNTASNASTRYDHYGFNSFAAFGGKHYGARPDGVYLLDGDTDAGRPIASGIALGQHDFGTQALKHINAVYAGVSSTGTLFLKVGDGHGH